MLSVDTLLIPILGGFLFIKYCQLTKYRAIRDNGYVILFKSAICGFFFYGISFIFWRAAILDGNINPKIPEWLETLNYFLGSSELIPALFSLVLIAVAVLTVNFIVDDDMMKRKVIKEDDDSLEITIQKAFDEEKFLQVTLDTRKVYIGKVTDTYFRVNDEIRSIQLNPIASGYRDYKTQKIILTTYYGQIYEKILEQPESFDVKISDFSVAIQYDHIISVSPFDPETYSSFQQAEAPDNIT